MEPKKEEEKINLDDWYKVRIQNSEDVNKKRLQSKEIQEAFCLKAG
jgi:hypothetical protein